MSHKKTALFSCEGKFLCFTEVRERRPSRLLLEVEDQHRHFKISKHCRLPSPELLPGSLVLVQGEEKIELETGETKRKIWAIQFLRAPLPGEYFRIPRVIQVCANRNCWKQGGKQVWKALQSDLIRSGVGDQIRLEKTGCLGNCDESPNIYCLPEQTLHGRFQIHQIPALIKKLQTGSGR